MAGQDFGGTMTLTGSITGRLQIRGELTVSVGRFSAESIVNQDGSVDRTFTPKSRRAQLKMVDRAGGAAALIEAPRQDWTIVEQQTGATHIFTNSFFTGTDDADRMNGDLTGLAIEGGQYRRIDE